MTADLTETEDRLRSAFADAAGTVREDELQHDAPLPRHGRVEGSGRGWLAASNPRRLVIAAAAAAAVIAISITAVTVPLSLHTGSRGLAPSASAGLGPTAYVFTSSDGPAGNTHTVVRIRLSTGTLVQPAVSLPAGVQNPVITPNGKTICTLTNYRHGNAYLTCINALTGVAGRPIAVPSNSESVAITPNGKAAYVLEPPLPGGRRLPTSPGGVLPVNLVTGSAGKEISIPGAQQVVITPDGRTAYVLSQTASRPGTGSKAVVPIDTATSTPLPPINVTAGGNAQDIAISPDGKTVYVTTFWVNHVSTVTPISTASNTAMRPMPIQQPPYSVIRLAIAPDGNTAYLYGTGESVIPIDLRTDKVLRPIRLPGNYAPLGYAFQIAPDSRTGYVYDAYGKGPDVIPVDLVTGTVQAPIAVARPPYTTISWPVGAIGIESGYLYAGVGYVSSPNHDAQYRGALSVVQLTTGKIKIIKVGLWPQYVFLAP